MMRKALFVAVLVCGLMAARRVHGQASPGFGGTVDGCGTDSPENPTLVLAGLATGGFALSTLRTHLRARRKTEKAE